MASTGTSSSLLHCFQSSKFISPRSSIELNRKCVSASSPGQGRSLRAFADSSRVMDQFTPKVENGVPRIVEVDLGNRRRSYPIYIGSGLLDKPELLQRHVHGKRVIVVTNNTIAPLYLDKVADALTRGNRNVSVDDIILPDGEQYKDLDSLLRLTAKVPSHELGERATFVALGGGVIGDICGFNASLYMRGVNFIQIPTTVMAQVDSSVGGKVSINHSYSIVDAVFQPQSVLIDTDTLNTLPDRELASGFAEVIKYGLIRDGHFFGWLEKNMQPLMARDPSALAYAIKRSCEIKAEIMSLDEKDSGPRPTLNLGHTFGKAIETKVGYGQWLHGEAVAAGMVMAVDLSHRHGLIEDSVVHRVHAILQQANLPTAPPENMTLDMFKSDMELAEMVAGGLLKLVLPRGAPGNCVFTGDYNRKALDATIRKFCKS